LRTLQEPLKERYREDAGAARVTLRADGSLGEGITCSVQTGRALAEAGLRDLNAVAGLRDPNAVAGLRDLNAVAGLRDPNAVAGLRDLNAVAGLHPATGGDGLSLCSGDMLLQALAACAGVTLRAVATALEIPVTAGTVHVEGDLDFRGTLAVSKEAPVGFTAIRVRFKLESSASREQLDTLLRLTERYCVVYQTLARSPVLSANWETD
jgi:uncharacterized OsmC-like protein